MGIWLQPGDVPGIDEPAITELIAELEAYLSLHFPCLLTLTPDKQALLKALLIPIVRRWNTTDTGSSGQVVAGPFQMRADSDDQGHSIEPEESASFRLLCGQPAAGGGLPQGHFPRPEPIGDLFARRPGWPPAEDTPPW